jgi:hypothetical protein
MLSSCWRDKNGDRRKFRHYRDQTWQKFGAKIRTKIWKFGGGLVVAGKVEKKGGNVFYGEPVFSRSMNYFIGKRDCFTFFPFYVLSEIGISFPLPGIILPIAEIGNRIETRTGTEKYSITYRYQESHCRSTRVEYKTLQFPDKNERGRMNLR